MPNRTLTDPLARASILLVDDSSLIIDVVRDLLERDGFEVIAATSSSEAEAGLKMEPEIVVLDVNLPGISGVELCRRIKQKNDVTVILFSQLPAAELEALAGDAGADGYLSKQSGIDKLPERLVNLCQASAAREPEPLRVLLIDDSELALHYERTLLELAGFEVRCARRMLDFVRALSSWEPHIVLSDVDMPELRGDQLCSTLKGHMSTRLIPIVLFSSLPHDELEELAKRAGADAFLSKQEGYDQLGPRLRELSEGILW